MPTQAEMQAASDKARLKKAFSLQNPLLAAGADVLTLPGRGIFGAANTALRIPRVLGLDIPPIPEAAFGGDSSSATPYYDRLRTPTTSAAPPPVSGAVPVSVPFSPAAAPVIAPIAAPVAKPTGENYFVNNQTGVRTEVAGAAPQTPNAPGAYLPRLAGAQESTGYQPTTLAGALVKNQETKRQSALQGQDIQNALAVYDTAGRQQAGQAELGERRLGRDALAATSGAKLAEDKRQFEALQAVPKFEYRTAYDPETGLARGTEVFEGGQPVKQPVAQVTVEEGRAAIKAGASKEKVNERLVAAGLAPIP